MFLQEIVFFIFLHYVSKICPSLIYETPELVQRSIGQAGLIVLRLVVARLTEHGLKPSLNRIHRIQSLKFAFRESFDFPAFNIFQPDFGFNSWRL